MTAVSPAGRRISKAEVLKVAHLARLAIDDAEAELFAHQLADVLEHARDIEELDVSSVPPAAHPLAISNVMREDEPHACLDRAELMAEAPATDGRYFVVPRILSDG